MSYYRGKAAKFEEGKPADPTENMSPEDAKTWHEMNDEHKDNFKAAQEKPMARFEEGKPADPTENMSPEDAKEWKAQTEANKDNFKTAAEADRMDRLFTSIGDDLDQAKSAWKKYQSDNDKFKPQLDNVSRDLAAIGTAVKTAVRTVEGIAKGKTAATVTAAVVDIPASLRALGTFCPCLKPANLESHQPFEDAHYELSIKANAKLDLSSDVLMKLVRHGLDTIHVNSPKVVSFTFTLSGDDAEATAKTAAEDDGDAAVEGEGEVPPKMKTLGKFCPALRQANWTTYEDNDSSFDITVKADRKVYLSSEGVKGLIRAGLKRIFVKDAGALTFQFETTAKKTAAVTKTGFVWGKIAQDQDQEETDQD